ncbi:MAG: hypothetical protein DRG78_12170 [Epsilonproteobacteria bacterium]|nr:MAG: hypothetical protein DRG78_12170 [Campylobacterota bacterium]
MFKIKKLDKTLLKEMNTKLIMLEIKGLHNSFGTLEKFSFSYLSFLIGYIINSQEVIYNSQNIILLFSLILLICFNFIQAKQYGEYEEELYKLATKKINKEQKC